MANRIQTVDQMTDLEIINRYRFDRNGITFLDQLLSPFIQPKAARNHSLSSRDQILVTLWYLATGPIQLNDADIHGISQPTISRVIGEVISALSNPIIANRFIKFPTALPELTANQAQFYGISHFPKVIGVIDGTHIRIRAPSINEEDYVNREDFHSINVQIVFDAFDKIIDIVARWPGATHDSRILQESGIRQLMEGGHLPQGQYHVLGDSGYACKSWLLTPYLNPQPGPQTSYNRSHKVTRVRVEKGIGQLKRRFGVLHGEINFQPEKACRVAVACAVLHNICKLRQTPMPQVQCDGQDGNFQQHINGGNGNAQALPAGLRYRDYIATTYF